MSIKEIYQNWRKSVKKRLYPDDVLTKRQQLVFSIFVDSLNDNNCIRFLNIEGQGLDKKYIVSKDYFINGEASLFITLITKGIDGDSQCNIVNHQYLYDQHFPQNTTRKMNKMFSEAVKRDRAKMENAMNKNSTNSLTQILIEFKERMKKQTNLMDDCELIKDEQTVIIPDETILEKRQNYKKLNK